VGGWGHRTFLALSRALRFMRFSWLLDSCGCVIPKGSPSTCARVLLSALAAATAPPPARRQALGGNAHRGADRRRGAHGGGHARPRARVHYAGLPPAPRTVTAVVGVGISIGIGGALATHAIPYTHADTIPARRRESLTFSVSVVSCRLKLALRKGTNACFSDPSCGTPLGSASTRPPPQCSAQGRIGKQNTPNGATSCDHWLRSLQRTSTS